MAHSEQALKCTHCDSPIMGESKAQSPELFCCEGCEAVYNIIQQYDLGEYYHLKQKIPSSEKAAPIQKKDESFLYLDDPLFIEKHASNGGESIDFYLEGIHCSACLWIIEKLPEIVKGLKAVRLDLGKGIVTVQKKPAGSFADAALMLQNLGYRPHPIQQNEEATRLQKKENNLQLIRLGVAAAGAGNIMLLALSTYSGLKGDLAHLFEWIIAALFLPVFFFSAWPFIKNSWGAIKKRKISIDVPIVFAIVIGTIVSFINLFRGSPDQYFDSLSTLIFLLLASRTLLRRVQQSLLSSSHLLHFLSPPLSHRYNSSTDQTEDIRTELLQKGDLVEVRENETVPVDGVLKDEKAHLDLSVFSGESHPQTAEKEESIFAGAVNIGEGFKMEVTKTGFETRLGQILKKVEEGHFKKPKIVGLADRIAQGFLVGMIALATLVFFLTLPDLRMAIQRSLTILIVTCPCALGLATPLTFSLALNHAARQGILLKGADVIEKMGKISSVIFDKTGTLTEGKFKVLQWMENLSNGFEIRKAVVALEKKSRHPIAKALVQYLSPLLKEELPNVQEYKEIAGRGVQGIINGDHYEIKALDDDNLLSVKSSGTKIGVWKNGARVGIAVLGDTLKEEAPAVIKKLKEMQLSCQILSGDEKNMVESTAQTVEVPLSQCRFRVTPEEKAEIVLRHPNALMVGEGINDSIALSHAFVSLAVQGSMEVSLRTADGYLSQQNLFGIIKLIQLGKKTRKIIYQNFAVSLFYNSASGIAAAFGLVHPLFAAILMPVSSFTVLISTLWGMRNKS